MSALFGARRAVFIPELLPRTRKHVIHTVGPIWSTFSDAPTMASQLASCYRTSLQLAVENKCKSIVSHYDHLSWRSRSSNYLQAFPLISTGIYRYPINEATHIALKETRVFLDGNDEVSESSFVDFGMTIASNPSVGPCNIRHFYWQRQRPEGIRVRSKNVFAWIFIFMSLRSENSSRITFPSNQKTFQRAR